MNAGQSPSLTSRSIESMPSVGCDVPGLWVVATETGTRYVIAVPPEGPPRAVRIAFYGHDRCRWRPFHSARALDDSADVAPVRVGARAVVRFTPHRDDWYRSTAVTAITTYAVPALCTLEEIVHESAGAMREQVVSEIADAARSRSLSFAEVEQLCQETGADLSSVHERLIGP